MENIGIGLLLMLVGMCTVFLILLIVIWLSQFLISVVNKIAPEDGCWSNGCYQSCCGYLDCR